ncbi:MAG: hypothetical protein KA149_02405 [Chitinophagales bacterium]|nr:hypothetical protein [Chitinophagales bacterium]
MRLLLPIVIFSLTAFVSCNNNPSDKPAVINTPVEAAQPSDLNGCYGYKTDKVTISLQVRTIGDTITGTLIYNYAEKDDNTGTFKGAFSGDTLFADYTFTSEGMETVREVAFVRSGDKLKEGYGDVEDKDGKIIFRDRGFLIFPGKVTLVKGECGK